MTCVLVTGATTPLGHALVERLLAEPGVEHVLALGVEPVWQAVPFIGPDKVTYRRVDLTRERHMRRLLFGEAREHCAEVVVHLAIHRRARQRGRRVHALNVEATRRLLTLAERHPTIRRFVFRSFAEVYDVRAERPSLIAEDHPLDLAPQTPQWIRDRVEADLTVCTRMGLSPMTIAVLRCAECLAPEMGSQLYDYLQSRVCFRPAGFDPMLNLATVDDLANALKLAALGDQQGVFTIPGFDTLPLSEVIHKWGRLDIPVPGPLLSPLYRWRTRALGTDFRYDINHWRFHFSGVLEGKRARKVLGYVPTHPVAWPTRRR